jgi:hypothetical protein
MPNCFQLLRDGKAVPLSTVDEELCKHFGAECHPIRYYEAWYDCVGYGLASGHSFDKIRDTYADLPKIVEIANWIEAHFEVRSWYEPKT